MEVGLWKTIEKVNASWNKDLIIRYLYVKLAPFFRRDVNFFLSDSVEQYLQYCEGFYYTGFDVVCQSICDFYYQLFKLFDIDSEIITTNDKKVPHFAMLVKGDNGVFFIDSLKDLFANQFGLRTSFFGVVPDYLKERIYEHHPEVIGLSNDYLDSLDFYLGISKNTGIIFDDFHKKVGSKNEAIKYFGMDRKSSYETIVEKKLELSSNQLINI